MKKKKIIFIIVIAVVVVDMIGTCIGVKLHNDRLKMEIRAIKYDEYCRVLCMPGLREEDYDDLKHVVMDAQPNEEEQKRLLIKVAYYNLEMGEDITMEQLLDSYNAFLDGDEEGSTIINSYYNSFYNGDNAWIGSENDFHSAIDQVLGEEGVKISTASEEQIEAAIQKVIAHPELVK